MKRNLALLALLALVPLVLTACASQPKAKANAPVVYQICQVITPQLVAPAPTTQAPQPVYDYSQRSWPQSTPTQQWDGYVPNDYQVPSNAFDSMPAYGGYYDSNPTGCYSGGCGVGASVGFGIGNAYVGIGPNGISAGVGLGCSPIGVGVGVGGY